VAIDMLGLGLIMFPAQDIKRQQADSVQFMTNNL